MKIILYACWFIIPVCYLVIVLWSKLESISKNQSREDMGDILRQLLFVALCVGLCIILDQFFLEGWVDAYSPDWIPLGFYQSILLPVMFLIVGRIAGNSAEIRITKAPHPSEKRRRRK